MKMVFNVFISMLFLTNLSAFNLTDFINDTVKSTKAVSNSNVTNSEIGNGLKEALNIGIKSAIDTLGKKDGFLKNENVKIPLPDNLSLVKTTLHKIGKERYFNELIVAMNRSAEKAVPKTVEIFLNSISKMEFKDVQKILFGADNEATNYFKKSTKDDLIKTLTPIIKECIAESKVVNYYNAIKGIYDSSKDTLGISKLTNAISEFSSIIPQSLKFTDIDIEQYVVSKTMDGVFFMIEEKEKELRNNPSMRTTKTLQKVFGSLDKE